MAYLRQGEVLPVVQLHDFAVPFTEFGDGDDHEIARSTYAGSPLAGDGADEIL